MPEFTTLEWTLIVVGAFGNAFLKRTFGAGVGITLMPILTISFSAKFSLVYLALCTTWVDISISKQMWNYWDHRFTFIFFPGMVIGVALGGWTLTWISESALRSLIGAICLAIAFYQTVIELRGRPPEVPRIPAWMGICFGPFSGMSATLANAGATILMPIMVGLQIPPIRMIGTIWALFFFLNPMRIAAYWNAQALTLPVFGASVAMLPVLWTGVRIGKWIHPQLPQKTFNLTVLSIALFGSLRLLIAG